MYKSLLLAAFFSTNAYATCFDSAKTGALSCRVQGDVWRGAESINEVHKALVKEGLQVDQDHYSLSFKVEEISGDVVLTKMEVTQGWFKQSREVPVFKGVEYGHNCQFEMESLDNDDSLTFTCQINSAIK